MATKGAPWVEGYIPVSVLQSAQECPLFFSVKIEEFSLYLIVTNRESNEAFLLILEVSLWNRNSLKNSNSQSAKP